MTTEKLELVTSEQSKVIRMIEENLEIKFTGKAREDAIHFIANNMKNSQEVSDRYKALLIGSYGGYKRIWQDIEKYREEIIELRGKAHMSCPSCYDDCISWVSDGLPCKNNWRI